MDVKQEAWAGSSPFLDLQAWPAPAWLPPNQPVLHAVLVGVIALGVLILVLVGTTLLLRVRLIYVERRHKAFIGVWRPLLMECLLGDPAVPKVKRHEWAPLMVLWNHLHTVLRGDALERLNALARRVGLDQAARRFLRARGVRRRLLAALTLGNVGVVEAWDELQPLAAQPGPYLSLVAMRALVQIDPLRAGPLLIRNIASRADWPTMRVATLLNETPPDSFVPVAEAELVTMALAQQIRLLHYLTYLKLELGLRVIATLLDASEPELLAAALPLAGPHELPRVRELTTHEVSFVRLHAAVALGRLGTQGDDRQLVMMLADGDWWVRYRAAQALVALPFSRPDVLERLREQAPHVPAREILDHVLAERRHR